MAEQKYRSTYVPQVGDFGKFILYRDKEGALVFAAKALPLQTTLPGLPREKLERLGSQLNLERYLGKHKNIAHALKDLSEVIGGAFFTVPEENKMNIFDYSASYGSVRDAEVQKCLGDEVKVTRLW